MTSVRRAIGAVAVSVAVTLTAGCSATETASGDAKRGGPPSTQEAE
jgi:hypothetical protein